MASRRINADLFIDLPERISRELKTEESLLDWLGVSIEKYFTLGANKFLSSEFWAAAEKALNGKIATVSPAGSSKSFQIKRGSNDAENLSVEILDETANTAERLEHATLGVLFRDREKKSRVFKKQSSLVRL